MQLLSFGGEESTAGISLEKDLALRTGKVFINYCMSIPQKAMIVFNRLIELLYFTSDPLSVHYFAVTPYLPEKVGLLLEFRTMKAERSRELNRTKQRRHGKVGGKTPLPG
jgi:hypothetical protein